MNRRVGEISAQALLDQWLTLIGDMWEDIWWATKAGQDPATYTAEGVELEKLMVETRVFLGTQMRSRKGLTGTMRSIPIEIKFKEETTIPEGGSLWLHSEFVDVDTVVMSVVVTGPDGTEIQRCLWEARVSSRWDAIPEGTGGDE